MNEQVNRNGRPVEEALRESIARLDLIARVSRGVVSATPIADQVRDLAEQVRVVFGVDACVVRTLEGADLILAGSAGLPENVLFPSLPANFGIAELILRERRPAIIADVPTDPVTSRWNTQRSGYRFRSYAGAPLMVEDRLLGILGIYTEHEPRVFTETDLEHLQMVANYVAVALENSRLYQEVRSQTVQLQERIAERERAEEEVRRLNAYLEQRVAERTTQLEVINQELEAFSYSVSHDLRAPLRAIDGFSRALLEDYSDTLDDDGCDYLNTIRSETDRMRRLVDDLLDLAHVTRRPMRRESVDLSAMAKIIAADLHRTQPERQVEFIIEPGLMTHGDETLLRVVLDNLMGNAWKYTGRCAQSRIEFGFTHSENVPLGAYFVRDNGAGFDMAFAGRLFGAFQRLHNVHDFPGNGIGLASVQRIVRRHGGTIWAEGVVDRGATFYFILPARRDHMMSVTDDDKSSRK